MKKSKKRTFATWSIVATAHTPRGLCEAALLRPGCGVGLVEVRLDCLPLGGAALSRAVAKIKLPVILTARHRKEGGARFMADDERETILGTLLPFAAYIDVELRSAKALKQILARARQAGVGTILSFHDFTGTPTATCLNRKMRDGLGLGASIVKIAVTLRGPRDLAELIALQTRSGKLATMGMGPLGKISRLVLPLAGARLVYGYLDRPQVDGQWPAKELATRLAELVP